MIPAFGRRPPALLYKSSEAPRSWPSEPLAATAIALSSFPAADRQACHPQTNPCGAPDGPGLVAVAPRFPAQSGRFWIGPTPWLSTVISGLTVGSRPAQTHKSNAIPLHDAPDDKPIASARGDSTLQRLCCASLDAVLPPYYAPIRGAPSAHFDCTTSNRAPFRAPQGSQINLRECVALPGAAPECKHSEGAVVKEGCKFLKVLRIPAVCSPAPTQTHCQI
ncbi:hypothetical protein BDV96DRAFT_228279 [Lophiotrema nucula]|uniref:Uncharacterized protein n=1 Tax=Lophiotrema nucula TaxID=690887 RepID=A0A6A5YSD0_9PLEO|nr:hypothetical protein BDV96DRAFT_228279 [Lophiotrema nucula]